jgi:hypothetical protein
VFNKNIFLSVIIGLVVLFIICFEINKSLIFHSDFARDLFNILKISQGNHTLLGPKLSFGGLYPASYYFYLFVPVFLLSGFNIMSIVYFNAFLFALSISYFFINASKKFSLWKSAIASFVIAFIPIFLFASRSPSVSNTYLAFLLMLLTYIYFNKIEYSFVLIFLGLMFGIIINFGFISFLILLPVYLMIFKKLKNKIFSFYFLLGVILSFLPLLVFELKNNFIMTKNTFFDKSYLSWIENKNIIYSVSGKKNIIENFFFMSNKLTQLILINPLIVLITFGMLQFYDKNIKRNIFLILNSLLALIILAVLIRFQFAIHYLYPTSFFLFIYFIFLLLESRFKILLFIILFVEIILFPKNIYSKSNINSGSFEKAVNFVIDNKLIDKKTEFNVVMIAHPNAIIGFEYRYFFQKQGYVPLSEFEYSKANTLLIFTQKKDLDISTLNTWEINQFGKQNFENAEKYKVDSQIVYKIKK